MSVEFHLLQDFEYGALLGMDTLKDYGIDLILTASTATMRSFCYDLTSTSTKIRSVLIRLKYDVTVYGHTCEYIPISSHMLPEMDYTFEP